LKTNDFFKNININVVFLLKKNYIQISKIKRLKDMRINYFRIFMLDCTVFSYYLIAKLTMKHPKLVMLKV